MVNACGTEGEPEQGGFTAEFWREYGSSLLMGRATLGNWSTMLLISLPDKKVKQYITLFPHLSFSRFPTLHLSSKDNCFFCWKVMIVKTMAEVCPKFY